MKLLLLVLPSFFLTLLLILHAVRVRGGRTALLFFGPAFLFGVVRGNTVALLAVSENKGTYIFSEPLLRIGRAEVPACVGWVFALYLSWTLAERIVSRIRSLSGRVFSLSALATLGMGCFSYAVETTASGVGWWRWNIVRWATPFLVGGTHLLGIAEWMSVGFEFLLPFLLFRTRKGARSRLAWASLLLYPLHWVTHWRQVTAPGLPNAYEIYHALIAISVMVFPLLRAPALAGPPEREAAGWVRRIPAGAILGMFATLCLVDLGILREPELLLSLLPLALFLAASLLRGRSLIVAAGVALAVTFGGSLLGGRGALISLARTVPILVPVGCVFLLGEWTGLAVRPRRRLIYAVCIGVVIVCAAVGMVRGKREREEYGRLMGRVQGLASPRDTPEAEALLKQAIALRPNVNLGYKLLAALYGGQGRYADAWRVVSRSLELDPTDWEVYRLGGNVLRAQGRSAGAIPLYERALMLNPSDLDSAKGLAECYLREQRIADGIGVLRRALSRNPADAELTHLLGALLVQTGAFREANRVVRRALVLAPSDPALHLLMAHIYAGAGDAQAARSECERVLQLKPGDEQAKRLLESLPE